MMACVIKHIEEGSGDCRGVLDRVMSKGLSGETLARGERKAVPDLALHHPGELRQSAHFSTGIPELQLAGVCHPLHRAGQPQLRRSPLPPGLPVSLLPEGKKNEEF